MKKQLLTIFCILMCVAVISAQNSEKREKRINMTVKEWKTPVRGTRYLDHITKYDENGRKKEDIEYTQSGQKARCVYEYNSDGKVSREIVYDENNKPYRIKKFEYNSDGSKKRQLNYSAKGVLISVKEFEYIKP